MSQSPDLILHRGLFTTLDRSNPHAEAVAIKDGRFTHVGHDNEIVPLAGPATKIIDLKGKRALPGLIDNHLHIIRGGLNFNMELRWDGVRSLWQKEPVVQSWLDQVKPHMFGHLPRGRSPDTAAAPSRPPSEG